VRGFYQLKKDLIDFADENFITIKFIPDTKRGFNKNLKIDYYDFFPVLSSLTKRCSMNQRLSFLNEL
jgi:hypothetical protein